MDPVLGRKLVVEFVGMFLFVFTVGMATNEAGAGALAPLAIGSILMVMVFAGGHVSGGHFNPAVSTAVFLRGRMAANEFGAYVATHFVAAVVAGLVVRYVGGREVEAVVASGGKMLVAEFIFTFALAWVVLHVATARGTDGIRSTAWRSGSRSWQERSRSGASPAARSILRSHSERWSQGSSSGATSGSTSSPTSSVQPRRRSRSFTSFQPRSRAETSSSQQVPASRSRDRRLHERPVFQGLSSRGVLRQSLMVERLRSGGSRLHSATPTVREPLML